MESARSARREGFFREFARRCHSVLGDSGMRVIVTGGFVTRSGMGTAIASGDADAIGVGRAAATDPELPAHFLDARVPDAAAAAPDWPITVPTWLPSIPLLGASWGTCVLANEAVACGSARAHRLQEGARARPLDGLVHSIYRVQGCDVVPVASA